MRKKKNPIWFIKKEYLQDLLNNKNSLSDVLRSLNLDIKGCSGALIRRIKEDNLCTKKLEINRNNQRLIHIKTIQVARPLNEICVENSTYSRVNLKAKLIKLGILKYECYECKLSEWRGKKICLQIDHINGTNNDHRIENLRLLCPNCHSQTNTYAGKNKNLELDKNGNVIKKKANPTHYCGICNKACFSALCAKCHHQSQRKFEVSKEELELLIKKFPMTYIGKMFGVSDNAIRKRAKLLGIDLS